jgi:transposase
MPRGATLLADNAYDSNTVRAAAANKNAYASIASRSNRNRRDTFSEGLMRQRNPFEHFPNSIRCFRGIAARLIKCPESYRPAITLASARIWFAELRD